MRNLVIVLFCFSLTSSLYATHCPNYNDLQFVGDHWELNEEKIDEGWTFRFNPKIKPPFIGFGARVNASGTLCLYTLRRLPLDPSQQIQLQNT